MLGVLATRYPCLHVDEGDAPIFTGLVVFLKDLFLGVDVVVEATLEAVDDYHLYECAVLAVPRHEVADELVVRHVLNVLLIEWNQLPAAKKDFKKVDDNI